jgi:hypothetical protein
LFCLLRPSKLLWQKQMPRYGDARYSHPLLIVPWELWSACRFVQKSRLNIRTVLCPEHSTSYCSKSNFIVIWFKVTCGYYLLDSSFIPARYSRSAYGHLFCKVEETLNYCGVRNICRGRLLTGRPDGASWLNVTCIGEFPVSNLDRDTDSPEGRCGFTQSI